MCVLPPAKVQCCGGVCIQTLLEALASSLTLQTDQGERERERGRKGGKDGEGTGDWELKSGAILVSQFLNSKIMTKM